MGRMCSGTPQSRPSMLIAVLWSLPLSLWNSPFPSLLLLGVAEYLQRTCFEAQFLLCCTGCLLSVDFLRINLKVALIKKKDVSDRIYMLLSRLLEVFPHNYKHHISSHLISHHCFTAFPSVLPGTKSREALRNVSPKKTPWGKRLRVSLRICTGFI